MPDLRNRCQPSRLGGGARRYLPIGPAPGVHSELPRGGGARPFSEYYTAEDRQAIFRGALRRNVVFSRHDLAVDGPFHRFQVILCRNVLIYFNDALTARIHRPFYESLEVPGFLSLGSRESIRLTPHETCYAETENSQSLYRKVR